jgi:prephenate dehydrogenase
LSRIAVVGLGLIGGSIALAARARAFDRDPDARARARDRGIDAAEGLAEAVADASIVVTAVPTAATPSLVREILALAPGTLVTDTASVKRPVVEAAGALPQGARFVGGHPMAGSRREGLEAADPALFAGRPWAVVPTPRSDPAGIDAVASFARSVGARPVVVEAVAHDRAMTWISHLPHSVAVALARAAASGAPGFLRELAGPGFLDTTRIAGRRSDLALELALADPEALARAIDAVGGELGALASALRRGDAKALAGLFREAAEARRNADPRATAPDGDGPGKGRRDGPDDLHGKHAPSR